MAPALGQLGAVQITTAGGDSYRLGAEDPIWTSGIADMTPETLVLAALPRLIYRREPCWIFSRDRTTPDDDWGDEEGLPVVHAIYLPLVATLTLVYAPDQTTGDAT